MEEKNNNWYEDPSEDEDQEYHFGEYDITSTPNDFNIKTIFDFINSGVVKLPDFQRNYVWDINRASKLIESIIIGLPIPQLFLYEKGKNEFLVIDGQQRLMTIYYFIKMRFPKKERRVELRKIFDIKGEIPEEILYDKDFFTDFYLKLPPEVPGQLNKLDKLNYATLKDFKTTFDLRPIRNVIIKQNFPPDDDSSIHEIFNRLNSGGMNLKPQEIRSSLYHSDFYRMLSRINLLPEWRNLIARDEPDIHMKDIEIILRCFALLISGNNYRAPMSKFLNLFSKSAKSYSTEQIQIFETVFILFLNAAKQLALTEYIASSGKFNISTLEAIFRAMCEVSLNGPNPVIMAPDRKKIEELKNDEGFRKAVLESTVSKKNVEERFKIAKKILFEK
ncbi:MAG: DUF262 domain-containing protein [Ignavibacteriales bacterium]|nr:DUF262 domain-containing protein [Ignavibacteriales bacterium]